MRVFFSFLFFSFYAKKQAKNNRKETRRIKLIILLQTENSISVMFSLPPLTNLLQHRKAEAQKKVKSRRGFYIFIIFIS